MAPRAPDAARRLAAIVESSDDAILSIDLTGTLTSWNRGAEQLYGYSASEALGLNVRALVPPDRQGEEEQLLSSRRRNRLSSNVG